MSRAEKPRHAREAPYLLRVSNRKAAGFSRILIQGCSRPIFHSLRRPLRNSIARSSRAERQPLNSCVTVLHYYRRGAGH